MSQPPFQPPPQPSQPPQAPQPPQSPYNPYNQPAPPPPQQQQPGFGPAPAPGQPPMPAGPPPALGQPPVHPMQSMHPTPQFHAPPFGQRPPTSGHPVGAVFLAFFVSVIVSMIYSGIILATYKEITSVTVANTLYLAHALLNGAIVGALVGAVGHRNNGAWTVGAVIAALGAFFGYTNAWPLIVASEQGGGAVWDLLRYDAFLPAKAWWNDESSGGVDWFSPLGLLLAAAAAWGLAYLIGNKRGRV